MTGQPPARYAFFDLDGTLLPWDTQLLFCNHVLRRAGWRRLLLLPFALCLPLAALKILRSRRLKQIFLSYLTGMSRDYLDELANEFANEVKTLHIWPAMVAEIEARRAEGCILVLNTASPEFYAAPIAKVLSFDHCVATRVKLGSRVGFCPPIIGPNNKRQAKITAMRERGIIPASAALPIAGSWAYTDSPVDIPLLECAESGCLVNPSTEFAALGVERGWRILTPAPVISRPHWRLAALVMMLGLWQKPD